MKQPKWKFVDGEHESSGRIRTQYDAGFFLDECERLDADIKLFINDKEVSRKEGIAFGEELYAAHKAKFESTHKQIWVHQGATNCKNAWHKKWVKK